MRRWLSDLVELEYLAVAELGRKGAGKTTRYRVVEHPPRKGLGVNLLSPKELRARLR